MRFRVLGPLEVFDGAEWHALGAAKTRALLATLLVNAGSVMSLDQLADELWGDAPPKTAANQVYGYVMRIRRLLGDPDGQLVVRRAPGYQLVVAPEDVDAQTFELQVKRGCAALRDGDPAQAATSLAAALALWRGPALIDVPATPLIEAAVARWEEQRLAALEARIDADLACGRHTSLAGEVGDLAREYPLREQFWGQLMLALYRCGRQADALAAYQQVRRVLGTELGIEPGAALCRLHEQILRTDAALDLKPAAAAVGSASTPAATPRQLPTDVAGFTGRADDLAELDALVAKQAGSRAVTIAVLIGTAGVGKTSLAVHWAHRIAAGYPDGQLYVNLHGYSTSPQVSPLEALTQFLRALGVPPDHIPVSVDEAAARFRSLVAGKRLLVVLDNAAAPEQVRPLLPGTPGCLVVVTSRDRLGGLMAGEGAHAHTLRTLRLDDAVALISRMVGAERVRAEPAAAADLAPLCAHLPLALRVAAANLASRPRQRISSYVADLAEDDRIVTLEADGDSGTAVRAAFELSYQRLSDPVRRLFRLLGAAPGAEFVVDAAAALTGATPAEARRLLDRLAGAHLVEEVDEGRYTFHDLLREFAAERARQEERSTDLDAAIGRLLDWYLRVTDAAAQLLSSRVLRLPPPPVTAGPPARFNDHVGALAWLDTHRSDLVAAIRHAAEKGPRTAAWQLADALRGYFRMTCHTADWLSVGGAGLTAAELDGDLPARAAVRLCLADAHRTVGEYTQALRHYEAALVAARKAGWRESEATVLGNMGTVHWYQGRLEQAADHYTQALATHRAVDRVVGMANTLTSLGCVHIEWGRLDRAIEHCGQALDLHRELGSRDGEAIDLHNLAKALHILGQLDRAADHATLALRLYREVGDREGEAYALTTLANVHSDAGRYTEALAASSAAHTLATEMGEVRAAVDALNALGGVYLRLGRRPDAVARHEQARALAGNAGIRYLELEASLGVAAARPGAPDRSVADAENVLAVAVDIGYRVIEGRALTALADLQLANDRSDQAIDYAERALASHRRTGDRLGIARTLIVLGRAVKRPDAALPHWQEALELLAELGAPEAEQVRLLIQRAGGSTVLR